MVIQTYSGYTQGFLTAHNRDSQQHVAKPIQPHWRAWSPSRLVEGAECPKSCIDLYLDELLAWRYGTGWKVQDQVKTERVRKRGLPLVVEHHDRALLGWLSSSGSCSRMCTM